VAQLATNQIDPEAECGLQKESSHRTRHPFLFSATCMALSSLDKTCIIQAYQVGIPVSPSAL
jgi:hypothetical protein